MSSTITPHTIITTHADADFDAVASIVAASKFYPSATRILPNMLPRNEPHPFIDNLMERFSFIHARNCDLSQVKKLIVVDVRRKSRLSHIESVFSIPDLEIHLYDHHPDTLEDLNGVVSVVKKYGSCVSILIELIKKQSISLTPDEATLLGLGLYEDTGSFTFPSTTENDFLAATFLLSQDMDFTTIAELMTGELTRQQIHLLDQLLSSSRTHNINGIHVTFVEISLDTYYGELASLITKLIEMERLEAIFAVIGMEDKIQIIARSTCKELDVGKICKAFGGGGHPEAAAANIKDKTIAEVRTELFALLVTSLQTSITVGTRMTTPVRTIENTVPIAQAEEIMTRFGLKAAPIVDAEGKCLGILDLHTASRANAHKLGNLHAQEYMARKITTLTPDADLQVAMQIILQQQQRLIPIVKDEKVLGVLTRTDILRIMMDESMRVPEALPSAHDRFKNVSASLKSSLPKETLAILKQAGETADELGFQVYAVGGFVRDLLLKEHNLDIDLSVEGDGVLFADAFAKHLGGRVRHHHKFKTAIIFYKDASGQDVHIDVATARMEYYEHPAALPSVEQASIQMDLYRRDFTINALAIHLNKQFFGDLVDPFRGQLDIKERKIAVLHSLSFVEDPTRILRAARFEHRFEFRVSQQTERLVKNSIGLNMIDKLSGARLFNELKHVFDERTTKKCLERLDIWGVLQAMHPQLALTPTKTDLLVSLEEVLGWYRLLYKDPPPVNWILYMLALCSNIKHDELIIFLNRIGLVAKVRDSFLQLRGLVRSTSKYLIYRDKSNITGLASLYEALQPLSLEGHLFLMASHGQKNNIGKEVSFYLTTLREVHADITGDDLIELGYPQGAILGTMLRLLLMAKLDGKAITREDQLALAQNYIMQARIDSFETPTYEALLATAEPEEQAFLYDERR